MSAASSSRRAFTLVVFAFVSVMSGTALPTPLYALYSDQLGFGIVTTTVVSASYAVGVIASLIVCGRWSDVVGRRPLLLAGIGLAAASAVVFLVSGHVWQLLIGRLLSGLSAGIYAGTATTAVIDAAPEHWRRRAPAVATAANIGGLGLGTLMAGLLAQYGPAPLHSPFVLSLVLVILAGAGVWWQRCSSSRRRVSWPAGGCVPRGRSPPVVRFSPSAWLCWSCR